MNLFGEDKERGDNKNHIEIYEIYVKCVWSCLTEADIIWR